MAIDRYSVCPCGSGKKLKFCCSDLAGELDQLEQMIKGEQFSAALTQVENLEKKHPNRECLLAAQTQLLRVLGRREEAARVVKQFCDAFPNNPIALAESTIQMVMEGKTLDAVPEVHRAIGACETVFYSQIYESMAILSEALGRNGQYRVARALLQFMGAVSEGDSRPMEMLSAMYQSRTWPLLTKDDPALVEGPEGVEWAKTFTTTMDSIKRGRWLDGEKQLTELAEKVDHPALWRNLAIVRNWLGDRASTAEAWHRVAETAEGEEAVEAEAIAMLESDDPLGDQFDSLLATFTIKDADELVAALSMSKQAVQVPTPREPAHENDVPPKAVFWVLDRPRLEKAEGTTGETMPRILGQARLFGRQTDREARLEMLGVSPKNVGSLQEFFDDLAADQFEGDPETKVLVQVSASRDLFDCPWFPPQDMKPDQMKEIDREHFENALLEAWPEEPLGVLDGKTPAEAVDDPALRRKVAAAILVMQSWSEMAGRQFDYNRLRSELNLPTADPIDPEGIDVMNFPPVRLTRLEAEKMSDETLRTAFHRAVLVMAHEAIRRFGETLLSRPSIEENDRQFILITLVRFDSTEKAFDWIEEGRNGVAEKGGSDVQWDLIELKKRLRTGT